MSVSLTELTARLSAYVPAKNNIPADYTQLVEDAVNQLGVDVPIISSITLSILHGVAEYTLPDDFVHIIDFPTPVTFGNVAITDSGIVPFNQSFSELYFVEGQTLRFDPAPGYSSSRLMRYAAMHVLDTNNTYPRMSINAGRIALLYGQYLVLMAQANVAQQNAWSYKIGDEAVDKKGQGAALLEAAKQQLDAYERAIKPFKGYGSRTNLKGLNPNDY